MDRFVKKQAEIDAKKAATVAGYPSLWLRMISEWQRPVTEDRAWLMYSANYLFRTAGIRWALDPLTLYQRVPFAPEVDISALAALDYVVLTHRHADHLDLGLLASLRRFPLHWIIPEFLLDHLRTLGLPREQMTIPCPLEPLHLGCLTLVPFEGQHWEADPAHPGGQHGVPAMGYLAEFNGKRWLFPGDTRIYDVTRFPCFGPLDGLFAHLWLGRGRALDNQYPLLESFGRFCLGMQPKQIFVTHLDEFGRPADEYWDNRHFQLFREWIRKHAPNIMVESAGLGRCFDL